MGEKVITKEITKDFKLNKNENIKYQNVWGQIQQYLYF